MTKKRDWIFVVLISITLFSFLYGNTKGTLTLSYGRILELLKNPSDASDSIVFWNIRLPRMILAALVGVNLALAGGILQGIMNNPLADPSIIGISSGAGFFGILLLVVFPQFVQFVPIAAFIGAMIAAGIIYWLAWHEGIETTRIILAGVAVSTLFGAGISGVLVFFSDRVHGALTFMNGSLSARSWPEVQMILPYTIVGLLLCLLFSEKLNILVLGDDVARGMGLDVEKARLCFTALAAFLAASAVSVVGLLGFVGLIVPHAVRMMMGSDYRRTIPACALLGASTLMLSDTFARTLLSPKEIPVGIVMAIIGVPFFLTLLRRAY